MLSTSFSVLLPVLFVIALGYWAGRAKRFDADQVLGINELVLDFAFPALMFVGIATTTTREMLAEIPFLVALFAGFAGFYALTVIVSRYVLHHSLGEAGLQAASVSFPSVAFMGIPIFGGLFGDSSMLSVSAANALGILIVVPSTVVLLEIDTQRSTPESGQASNARSAAGARTSTQVALAALLASLKKPLVWAPLLAIVLVALNLRVPAVIDDMVKLIGSTTSGVALFASGLVIVAYEVKVDLEIIGNVIAKMILQPAFVAAIVLLFAIGGPLGREAILISAIPTAVFPTLLAPRYGVYVSECASTLILTTLAMIVVLPLAILLTGGS